MVCPSSSAAQASECERFGEDEGMSPNWACACRHHIPCGDPVPNLMKQLRWRWQQDQAEQLICTALGDVFHHLFSASDVLAAHPGLLAAMWGDFGSQCYSTWEWHAVGSQNTPGGSCMQALRKGNSLEVPPGQGCLYIFLLGKHLLRSQTEQRARLPCICLWHI